MPCSVLEMIAKQEGRSLQPLDCCAAVRYRVSQSMPDRDQDRSRHAAPPSADRVAEAISGSVELEGVMRDALQGDPVAQCRLGRHLLNLDNELEAMNQFRHAAYQGHDPAWLLIGAMCGHEWGVKGTHEDVAKWYIRAVATGHPTAQLALAGLYREGVGVDADQAEATRFYRLAAEQGELIAQFYLGLRCEFGMGVKSDAEEATKWLRIATQRGHPDARFLMGKKYLYGMGVEVNASEGVRLLTECAEQGDLGAIVILAVAYGTGTGLRENLRESVKWFRRYIGLTTAQDTVDYATQLISKFRKGSGTPLLPHIFLSLAAGAGHGPAKRQRKRLERLLLTEDLKQSRAITRRCRGAVRRKWRSRRRRD